MKRALAGVFLIFSAIGNVQASPNYYGGGKLMLMNASVESAGVSFSSKPTGLAVFGGASLSHTFGAEGSLFLFGNESKIGSSSTKLQLDSFIELSGVAKTQPTSKFELSGRGGLAIMTWKDSEDEEASVIGITLAGKGAYFVNRDINVFLEYQYLPKAEYDKLSGVYVKSSSINLGGAMRF